MTHPIPDKVLETHTAILAMTGAGKTVTAKGLAERVVKRKERFCGLDPYDGWWGMRAKGKGPGLPVVVFGGQHADYPITRHHGRMLAEIIGKSNTPAIISTRLFSVAERTDFFIDFAETLMRVNKGTLHLFIDEAHLFMPQKVEWGGRSGQMVQAGNNLVSGGRGLGLRIVLISQRAAKLHKDSLTQCQTLIAMQVTHKLDRNAVDDWIGEFASKKDGEATELRETLPYLDRGEAWIWSPISKIKPTRIKVPMIQTYDSSAPGGGKRRKPRMMKIDLAAIKDRLGAVAKEAEENDVPKLRAKIAALTREAAAKPKPAAPVKAAAPVIDQALIERTKKLSIQIGRAEGIEAGFKDARGFLSDLIGEHRGAEGRALNAFDKRSLAISRERQRIEKGNVKIIKELKITPGPSKVVQVQPARSGSPGAKKPSVATGTGEKLPPGEKAVLIAAVQFDGVERDQLSILTGYKRSTRNAYISRLEDKGHVEIKGDRIEATDSGREALGSDYEPLPTGAALLDYWRGKLPEGERKVLEIAIEAHPESVERDALDVTGFKKSTRNAYIARLEARRLVTTDREGIRASDNLF